jgi:uncharacterized phage protein gp47/JayE
MPRFEPKTFKTFLERMANRVVARSELTDLEEGGNLHTILSAAAREMDDLSYQMVNLQRLWDLDTAQGEDLDARALDLNPDKLERRGASYATGLVVYSRAGTSGTVAIPAGSVAKVPDGGPEFETSAAGEITDGSSSSASIAIIAVEAGSEGNVDASTITQLDAISGVETVTNATPTTGGQDEETDAEFRERIKTYLRSLPRGTPDALKFAVLNTFLDDFGRIVTAEIVELEGTELGQVLIYVDDGAGTIVVTDDNIGSPETVVASAIGGEVRLFLQNKPVVESTSVDVEINAAPVTEGVDYTLNRATGQITLDSTLYPLGLTAGDNVTAEYTWYEGLIEEAQKIIDGDPADRENYPGYRAAGTQVFLRSPNVLLQTIAASVVVDVGFDGATVRSAVQSAIVRYINSLPINGDVILSELIYHAQTIDGVIDVTFTAPVTTVTIGEGELARVTTSNVTIT